MATESKEYIIPEEYVDKTPAANLDQKTLNKMVWRSLFLQGSFNYERMQSAGWLYGILPGLEKIHTNKDDLAASMSHNMEFFNTHPFLVNFVMGIVLSMEQNKSEIPSIRAVRVAAMGPLGGIGDALFWFTLVPITAGITANMAIQGNIAAPFIFLIIFNVAQFAVRYILMNWSYKLGIDAIGMLTARAKEFTRAASILGVFVVGVLTCVYGGTSINVIINNGTTFEGKPVTKIVSQADLSQYQSDLYDDTGALKADSVVNDLGSSGLAEITYTEYTETPVTIDIQKILNDIMPKIIPLFLTLMIYLLLSKFKWTPIKAISLILVLALVGSGFGLWPTIWP